VAVNLREQAELDLRHTLEGAFKLPVVLIDPDGNTIDTSENDGLPLVGQVLYDTVVTDPATGGTVVIDEPVVTLRRSSLSRVPAPGENWAVRIPLTPSATGDLVTHLIDPSKSPEGGASIGFIRLYLKKAAQS